MGGIHACSAHKDNPLPRSLAATRGPPERLTASRAFRPRRPTCLGFSNRLLYPSTTPTGQTRVLQPLQGVVFAVPPVVRTTCSDGAPKRRGKPSNESAPHLREQAGDMQDDRNTGLQPAARSEVQA